MSETDASPPVLERQGHRATIRLNRPKHLNRLQAEDLDVLPKLFAEVEADPAIRVLVLTGTGRAFSAGYDLNSVTERATSDVEQKSGIARYVARLGLDNAKRLFLTAEKIGATEMLRIGYLTSVVPAEALDEEVDRLATVIAGNAPVAMRGMKRTIHEIARGELDVEAADRRHRDSMRGDEIKEGIKAFAEKRPPRF
jgi:enoyl-CoA hydratase/carnithine racemase